MSNWTVSASTPSASLQAQIYAKEAWLEARVNSFWSAFMGEGPNNAIHVNKSFIKTKGDAINYTLVNDITTRGLGGTTIQSYVAYNDTNKRLEGQEAAITTYSDSVLLDQLREGLVTGGQLSEQRSSLDQREHMKQILAYWSGRILMDEVIFKKLSGVTMTDKNSQTFGEAATANSLVIYGGAKTARNQLTSSDTFTLNLLRRAKTAAMVGNSSIWRMRPMMISGRPYYGCVVHPYQVYDLQGSQEWEQAMREAQVRGPENPLFTGALGIWNGVILYSHDKVVTGSDAGPGGDQGYASGLFFGYQAGLWAQAQPAPNWIEKKFDYDDQYGIATGMVYGFDKTTFNSKDFGVIKIETAASDPSTV